MFASLLSGVVVVLQLVSSVHGTTVVPLSENHPHFHNAVAADTKGKMLNVSGVPTYVTLPEGSYDKSLAVLVLTDIFGLPKVDNLILADGFAKNGFATYAPDYLNGDAFPESGNGDINAWITKHGLNQTIPPLTAVLNQLRTDGVKKIAATGYCFGGLYVVLLAQNNSVEAISMAHPSLLTVPDDFTKIKATSKVPVQINNAELDTALTPALAVQVDTVFADGKYAAGYERKQFTGVGHGFATSADPANAVQVAARDGALNNAVAWFHKYLMGM